MPDIILKDKDGNAVVYDGVKAIRLSRHEGGYVDFIQPELAAVTVTPTGEEFTEYPDGDGFSSVTVAGDENLVPENIKSGVTVYGVTGTATSSGADTEIIPTAYADYVAAAKELYTGDYTGLMIMDSGVNTIGVCFLMDDFAVVDYNSTSTFFSMQGAVYCKYTKSTDTWEMLDYRTAASTGEHYATHIRYSTRILYYGTSVIYPRMKTKGALVPYPVGSISVNFGRAVAVPYKYPKPVFEITEVTT